MQKKIPDFVHFNGPSQRQIHEFIKISYLLIIPLLAISLLYGCESHQSGNTYATLVPDTGNRFQASQAAVSSANPLASSVGKEVMEQGGNAVDAAVATAFVLGVVEPHMSGIGGGGNMMIWNQEDGKAEYVDFYAAKRAETYRDFDYDQVDEEHNLLSVGIPGTVAGLLEALERHGTMSREEVMEPAIQLAEDGFPVYPNLLDRIEMNREKLMRYEGAVRTYFSDDEPLALGEILRQPELAATLRKISEGGRSAFYEGALAENIIEVLNEGDHPVSEADFSEYEPQWDKRPICSTYKDYTVLSAPPPQTGIKIINALNLVEDYDLSSLGYPAQSSEAFDILTSAMRVSTADRREFITDPNWQTVPVEGMQSKAYASMRGDLVGTGNASEEIEAGDPFRYYDSELPAGCELHEPYASADPEGLLSMNSHGENGTSVIADRNFTPQKDHTETTHFSIIDPEGNAVSYSGTLSPSFGSGAWVNGIVLNDSGYSFEGMEHEEYEHGLHPYRIRSSTVSPTIVLHDDELHMVVGAPGGSHIPTGIFQTMVYALDYELDILEAVRMPRIFPSFNDNSVQIERGVEFEVLKAIRDMGYNPEPFEDSFARLYVIVKQGDTWTGAADPRHDGAVKGF